MGGRERAWARIPQCCSIGPSRLFGVSSRGWRIASCGDGLNGAPAGV